MGVRIIEGGRAVEKDDLADSAVEAIRRNATGNIQHTQVAQFTGTTLTGITGTSTTQTSTARAFASSVQAIFTTSATPTAGTVFVARNGTNVTTAAATTSATISTTGTFTETAVTWTVGATAVAGGTVNINTATISREDERG